MQHHRVTMRFPLALAIALVANVFAAASSWAFCMNNLTSETVTVSVSPGDFEEEVAPDGTACCHWTNPSCNPTEILTGRLRATFVREGANQFECQVYFEAGAGAEIREEDRSELGITPNLHCNGFREDMTIRQSAPYGVGLEKRHVRFLATGDLQYSHSYDNDPDDPDNANSIRHGENADEVAATMNTMVRNNPDIRGILNAGDLTQNARVDEFDFYLDALSTEDRFWFDGVGNHDLIDQSSSPCLDSPIASGWCVQRERIARHVHNNPRATVLTGKSYFKADSESPHYSWDWHDVHFVQLNLFPGDTAEEGHCPKLDPALSLTFLKHDLAQHVGDSGRPVVLTHHYGFDTAISDNTTAPTADNGCSERAAWWTEAQKERYWDAIADYNVIGIFTGHWHASSESDMFDIYIPWKRPDGKSNGPAQIDTFVAAAALNSVFLDVTIHENTMEVTRRLGDGSPQPDYFFHSPKSVRISPVCDFRVTPKELECGGSATLDGSFSYAYTYDEGGVSHQWEAACGSISNARAEESTLSIESGLGQCPSQCKVSLEVTDERGRTSGCYRLLRIRDTIDPELTNVPADATFQCTSDLTQPTVGATDSCDPSVDVTFSDDRLDGSCPNQYTLQRSWTATDSCGNATTEVRNLVVHDDQEPALQNAPSSAFEQVDCAVIPDPPNVTSTDRCEGSLPVTFEESAVPVGACSLEKELTRTWTATDSCGNQTSSQQKLFVTDGNKPALVGVPADMTVSCRSDAPPAPNVTATDACDPSVAVTLSEDHRPGSCPSQYTVERSWTATDACGNQTTQISNLVVQDDDGPVLQNAPSQYFEQVDCSAIPNPPNVSATDRCDGSRSVAYEETEAAVSSCPLEKELTRTWTTTDVCGNQTSSQHKLLVTDRNNPVLHGVPADTTVHCHEGVPPAPDVTATDACDPSVLVTLTEEHKASDQSGQFEVKRTWSTADACGNGTQESQTIAVIDSNPPQIYWVRAEPGTLTPADGQFYRVNVASSLRDACDPSPTCEIVEIRSNEPDGSAFPGDQSPDWRPIENEPMAYEFRAENDPTGNGRRYTAKVRCTDTAGNSSDKDALVDVPVGQNYVADVAEGTDPLGCQAGEIGTYRPDSICPTNCCFTAAPRDTGTFRGYGICVPEQQCHPQ